MSIKERQAQYVFMSILNSLFYAIVYISVSNQFFVFSVKAVLFRLPSGRCIL